MHLGLCNCKKLCYWFEYLVWFAFFPFVSCMIIPRSFLISFEWFAFLLCLVSICLSWKRSGLLALDKVRIPLSKPLMALPSCVVPFLCVTLMLSLVSFHVAPPLLFHVCLIVLHFLVNTVNRPYTGLHVKPG